MSGAAQGSSNTAKPTTDVKKEDETAKDQQKPNISLEEDDEFEDFPVEDWPPEETEVPANNARLWEESWDDDDTTEDFSKQLKEELKKVEGNKGGSS